MCALVAASATAVWSGRPWWLPALVCATLIVASAGLVGVVIAQGRWEAHHARQARMNAGVCTSGDVHQFLTRHGDDVSREVVAGLYWATVVDTNSLDPAYAPNVMLGVLEDGTAPERVWMAVQAGVSEDELIGLCARDDEQEWEAVALLAALSSTGQR